MSNKAMIIGTGNVGASIAYCLINQRTAVNELVLVDINQSDAEGEMLDLRDTLAVSPSFINIHTGTYSDASDCDIVIITAGAPQKPGETRLDLLAKNAKIFQPMITQIMASGFSGIFIIVSNPVDIMTYLTWHFSGLPPRTSHRFWHRARFCPPTLSHRRTAQRSSQERSRLSSR